MQVVGFAVLDVFFPHKKQQKRTDFHCLDPRDAFTPSCFHVQIIVTLFAEDRGKVVAGS
jgi:hypothetical protein